MMNIEARPIEIDWLFEQLKKIEIQSDIIKIQNTISEQEIKIISNFGKKVTRHKDLYEKYWHLTHDYKTIPSYRKCDFYSSHQDKNNILFSGISPELLDLLSGIHRKILDQVSQVAFTMYPAYVTTHLTNTRSRLPIHTHNTHQTTEKNDDRLISLSFAICLTNKKNQDDQTRIRFYTPHAKKISRLEEELKSNIDEFRFEFKPSQFSVYGFNTENSPHSALCGDNLYMWLVFDYVEFKFPFEYEKYKFNENVLAFDYF